RQGPGRVYDRPPAAHRRQDHVRRRRRPGRGHRPRPPPQGSQSGGGGMIGRLRGLVAEVGEEEALIDVAGVGYVVRCGSRTLGHLPALGEETVLHVESQWAESTGMKLYGFLGRDERRVFVMLQAIQGVGPKAALSVLDVLPPAEL